MKDCLTITLEYRMRDAETWTRIELEPHAYFELLDGEEPTIDGVARHDHAVAYLPKGIGALRATRLTIVDAARGAERVIAETFWNEGRNRAIERTDRGPDPYWELILDMQSGVDGSRREIVRVGRDQGVLVPRYHGIFERDADGSSPETGVDLR